MCRTANRRCGISKNNDRSSRWGIDWKIGEEYRWVSIPLVVEIFLPYQAPLVSTLTRRGRESSQNFNNCGKKISIVHSLVNFHGFNIENVIYFTVATIYLATTVRAQKTKQTFWVSNSPRDVFSWNAIIICGIRKQIFHINQSRIPTQ